MTSWQRRGGEYLAIAVLFAGVSVLSSVTQRASVAGQWDGARYQDMADQMVRGAAVQSEAPFVYRVALPWAVATLYPTDLVKGFTQLNIAAAAVACLLLAVWLEIAGVRSARLRVLLVALFIAAWHGPSRFVYFAPTTVDPPLFVFLLAGSILAYSIAREYRPVKLVALMAVCAAGTLCRESMVLVPAAFLFINNPLGPAPARRVPRLAVWGPALACAAAMVAARQMVHTIGGAYSFAGAIRQMLTSKPLFTMPLAAFIAFGPILAVLMADWRGTMARLREQQYVGALLAGAIGLAYIGGSDTERLLFWSAPAVYVLIGFALQTNRRALASPALVAVVAAAQLLSSRLLWGIPDPQATGADIGSVTGLSAKAYAVLNRLLSIDAFYFNLWSYFANHRVRVVQLLIYASGSLVLVWWMRRATGSRVARAERP
jgi:hypothetical protein